MYLLEKTDYFNYFFVVFKIEIVMYHIMKMASKTAIDEWPDGKDLDASRTNKLLSIVFVHVYSVMNSLQT